VSAATILIVDDSLTVRMDLADAFEAAGYEPLPCATAAEARQRLGERPIDLVVLDVILPDGDGIELLRELRSRQGGAATPVLLLSSEAEVQDRIRGMRTGANEFVGKPYDRNYVVARARELVLAGAPARAPERATVLLIDDSPTFRNELRRVLEEAGYAVATAETGEEGLRLADLSRPAAVVVDGVLPGIDGATVVRRLRLDAALRRTPCILLTASEGPGSELNALEAGADDFVRKSEEPRVILARLASLLRASPLGAEAHSGSALGPRRLLAVDDSITYLEELAARLQEQGYDVVRASSGEEALELLAVQKVDCILLDVMMPGLSGPETCERIKSDSGLRDIPLVLLTALEDREAMVEGLATGADDYIAKSSDFEVLLARVAAQLRRRQIEDEARRMRSELFQRELEAAEARSARAIAESRERLVAELERKNQELEAFSYSVSHDLRAPLRSVDGFSRLLAEECTEALDERGRDYVERIRGAARRMGELIDDLLELSRVGRAELECTDVDLSALARSVLEAIAHREGGEGLALEVAETPPASADPRLIRVALENLLGNAWKFTARAGIRRIGFHSECTDGETRYIVEDNGVGFDMGYAGKLFRPFERLHREADFPGTGIGLATVARIVDRHGGRVWAEGEVGVGARVTFTLGPAGEANGR
jgi:DNA-binding response OmpR family regulator